MENSQWKNLEERIFNSLKVETRAESFKIWVEALEKLEYAKSVDGKCELKK